MIQATAYWQRGIHAKMLIARMHLTEAVVPVLPPFENEFFTRRRTCVRHDADSRDLMPAQPNQSLIHGIACLQTVVAAERPIGSREVARLLDDEHTRVSRLLSTLASIGMLEQTPQRKYQPGPGLHVLAAQSLHASMLLTTALPHLKSLIGKGMTVALGVLWQRQICFLFHSKPGQAMEDSIGRHQFHPAERSSPGLALLAHALPRPKKKPAHALISAEATDPVTDLDAALESVRELGYARLRFAEKGILSLGLPLFSGEGAPIAALGISGPWKTQETAEKVHLLRETAGKIMADLFGAHEAGAARR
jgi:DNA-binding IclR family transcriptional regulator